MSSSKLKAQVAAQSSHAARARSGRLGLTAIVGDISVSAAKARSKRARKNAPAELGPTPERLRKGDDAELIAVPVKEADTRSSARVTRMLTVFDAQRSFLPPHLAKALEVALEDFDIAIVGNRRLVAAYSEAGGTAYGPRHGGVPDAVRAAYSRIVALQAALGQDVWHDLLTYVAETANSARHIASAVPYTGTGQARAYCLGWDRATIVQLAKAVAYHLQRERGLQGARFSAEEISASRQARREDMARRRRVSTT